MLVISTQNWSILAKFAKKNPAKSAAFYWLFLGGVSPHKSFEILFFFLRNIKSPAKKIEASPVLWTCQTQGARHIISIKKMRFSSHPRAKVRQQGPPGSARRLPWWEFNIWNGPVWSFSLWISFGNTHALYYIQHP